jgi:hypothetical protein
VSALTENPRSTAPSTGHAHAIADGPAASAKTNAEQKHITHLVVRRANIRRP